MEKAFWKLWVFFQKFLKRDIFSETLCMQLWVIQSAKAMKLRVYLIVNFCEGLSDKNEP